MSLTLVSWLQARLRTCRASLLRPKIQIRANLDASLLGTLLSIRFSIFPPEQ